MEKVKKRKKSRNLQLVCFVMIFILFFYMEPTSIIKASSATVYFETEEQTVTVGNEIVIYLCVESDATLGNFEGNLSYSSDKLEFTGGSGSITGEAGVLQINDIGTTSVNTRKYTMKFKVIDTGAVELKMTGTPAAYEAETMLPMSVSCMNYTLTSAAPQTASENADLEVLKISPGILEPEFNKTVTEYKTTVDADTTNLVISAIPADMAAKVNIVGNEGFIAGENEVQIQVTAENGKLQTYVISVNKEEPVTEEEETEEEETDEPEFRFGAYKENGTLIINGRYYYKVATGEVDITIPNGYIKTSFLLDGYTIPAYQPAGEENGDYLLLVLINEAGETALYRYDRVEKTIQRFHDDQIVISRVDDNSKDVNELKAIVKEYQEELNQMGVVVAVLCGLCGILLIGLIRFYMKSRGMHEDELD